MPNYPSPEILNRLETLTMGELDALLAEARRIEGAGYQPTDEELVEVINALQAE